MATTGTGSGEQKLSEAAQLTAYYLKQALPTKNVPALRQLLVQAAQQGLKGELVQKAQVLVIERANEMLMPELNVVKVYLKQGMELKNTAALGEALRKLDTLTGQPGFRRLGPEFHQLVEQARKMSALLAREECETVKYYLKQGLAVRNREVLKESMDKAHALPPGSVDKELIKQAAEMLATLDAEHLIKFYLSTAVKQKDLDALEATLSKAATLKMAAALHFEVAEATKMLADLKAKAKKKAIKKRSKQEGKGFLLFGGSLTEAVRRSDRDIPKICYQCMDFLTQQGLQEPGLFRVPGNKDLMDTMMARFEDEEEVKLEDVNDVAGVLKLYLRKLPEPLIPYDKYSAFIRAGIDNKPKESNKRNEIFRELLATIPRPSYALLQSVCRFLVSVAANADVNKMSTDNLAIVFAPNLLRPREETPFSMMTEMPVGIAIINSFISDYDTIFAAAAGAASAAPTATSATVPSQPAT